MSGALGLLLPETIELCSAMVAGHCAIGLRRYGLGGCWPMPPPPVRVPLATLLVMVLFCTLTVVGRAKEILTKIPPPSPPAVFPEIVEFRMVVPLASAAPASTIPPPFPLAALPEIVLFRKSRPLLAAETPPP